MKHDDIRTVAKECVRETLIGLGFDPDRPQEMQRHLAFLGNMYNAKQSTKREARVALIRWATPAFAFAIWQGIRRLLG